VLGGLAHRDVHVGQAGRGRPLGLAALGPRLRALPRVAELLVGRTGVGGTVGKAAHGLHATRDEDVALAGLDRVRSHADRLQRRRAVPVHRHAGYVDAGDERGDAPDVRARFPGRLAAAPDDVFDLRGVEVR